MSAFDPKPKTKSTLVLFGAAGMAPAMPRFRIDLGQSLLSQELRLKKISSKDMGGTDDQIDRFCCLRRCRHNISTGNTACAYPAAGQHDHASRGRMRIGHDTS